MNDHSKHLEAIGGVLAIEASERRIAELEAERTQHLAALQAAEARLVALDAESRQRLEVIGENEKTILALETDRAARLDVIHAAERTIAEIESDRAARLAEILRLQHQPIGDLARQLVRRVVGRGGSAPARAPAGHSVETPVVSGEAPETAVFRSMSTDRALWRIARRNLAVGTVIDVGASNGMWSAVCERHFPSARYLLVEAQETHRHALEAYCRQRPHAEFVLAAGGPRQGEIWFDDSDPFGGLASDTPTASMRRKVPVTTLDHEVATRRLPGPHLVKLDVHGFEVPILEGAIQTLRDAALVVIECYTFRVASGSLLFDEMVAWMRERGFGVIDASEPLWRARDACLWQMDFFFAPLSRPEFASNTWT